MLVAVFFIGVSLIFWVYSIAVTIDIWRQLKADQSVGVVVSNTKGHKDGTVYYPVIEYRFCGETKSFQSEISASFPLEIGSEIPVVIKSDVAERRTIGRSIVGLILLLSMAILFLLCGAG